VALFMNPLVLVALLAAVLLIAVRCGVLREAAFFLAISGPVALLIAIVNPIVSQQGVTVLVAGLHLPLIGTFDITQEAVIYGLVLALRTMTIFAICAVYVATVDPDDLLRVLRRYSVRSAITASLAVRFVPMLARDGADLAAARACRPGDPPSATAVIRATFARSLDRADDSAMALETRGYALARPLRVAPPPRRAADRWVLTSTCGILAVGIGGAAAGVASFTPYPTTQIATAPRDIAFAVAMFLVATIPAWPSRTKAQR
jgi:energy-coupling factor transport system permease protein